MKLIATLLICIVAILGALPAWSVDTAALDKRFAKWVRTTVLPEARAMGINAGTLSAMHLAPDWSLPGLSVTDDGTQHQSEFRAPALYFDPKALATAAREGQRLSRGHGGLLKRLERETGVPGRIVLAIWWRETRFGQAPLRYDALNVLATRAYSGPRKGYYMRELMAALQLIDAGSATRAQLRAGSGGAVGQPQFMPSSYRQFGNDGNGDGRVNLLQDADSLASIAAFLRAAGWTGGLDWGYEVRLPPAIGCNREAQDRGQSYAAWLREGVTRVNGRAFPNAELEANAYLLTPAGAHGPAFLVGDNFLALKRYNTSDLYALAVGNLADRIGFGMGEFRSGWVTTPPLHKDDIRTIQAGLTALGLDTGGVDGLAGYRTRRAIGTWQARNGMTQTCWPDPEVLRAFRR